MSVVLLVSSLSLGVAVVDVVVVVAVVFFLLSCGRIVPLPSLPPAHSLVVFLGEKRFM